MICHKIYPLGTLIHTQFIIDPNIEKFKSYMYISCDRKRVFFRRLSEIFGSFHTMIR